MFQQNPPLCTATMRNKINGSCVFPAASFSWLLGRHGAGRFRHDDLSLFQKLLHRCPFPWLARRPARRPSRDRQGAPPVRRSSCDRQGAPPHAGWMAVRLAADPQRRSAERVEFFRAFLHGGIEVRPPPG